MKTEVVSEGNSVRIVCSGMLDLTNCQQFHEEIRKAAAEADSVTVDLSQADFIDTAVVQDLAKAAVTLINRDKRLKVIASEAKYPVRVLRISGFHEIMDIEVIKAG